MSYKVPLLVTAVLTAISGLALIGTDSDQNLVSQAKSNLSSSPAAQPDKGIKHKSKSSDEITDYNNSSSPAVKKLALLLQSQSDPATSSLRDEINKHKVLLDSKLSTLEQQLNQQGLTLPKLEQADDRLDMPADNDLVLRLERIKQHLNK